MDTRTIGDLQISLIGLGSNNFGPRMHDVEDVRDVVEQSIELGVTFIDTANVYGRGRSEEMLGEVLGPHRDRVQLATKFGMDMADGAEQRTGPRGSRAYVRQAVEASLRRLQTDVIDLYQYHEPDGVTPIVETLGALDELVQEGKVREIGSSNFSAAQIEEADRVAREEGLARFVTVQNQYSLLCREIEDEVLPLCERLEIGVLPFYPLHRGLLTGKYRRDQPAPEGTRLGAQASVATAEEFDQVEALSAYAEERGLSLLDVAIGALAAQPAVASVITGARHPEQIAANVAALRWAPTAEDLAALPR